MAGASTVKVTFLGDLKSLSAASKKASAEVGAVGESGKKSHAKINAAMAGAAVAVVAFGKKSMDTFTNVGKETLKLQRYMGGSAEEASRLRFAAQETGVDVDTLAKGVGILSKHLGANDKAAKALGIAYRDSQGKIRPMAQLLPEISEKIAKMPNGAAKTALVLQTFGKSGMDLLPFLNKGSEGLKQLTEESDKLGNTLSGKDLQAVKDNTKAKREWHAAIQGVQIQLGRNLFPILTKGATILAQVASFVERNGAVMKPLIIVVATLVAGIKLWTIAQAALNLVMSMNPIGLVVIALAALAAGLIYAYKHSKTFREIVQAAFGAVSAAASFMWNDVLKPTFKFIIDAFLTVAGSIVHSAATAFGWIPGLGGKLKNAAKQFDKFKNEVNAALDGVHKDIHITAHLDGYTAKQDLSVAHRYAAGTRGAGRGLNLVGEHGPELMYMRGGEGVLNAQDTRAALSGGGGTELLAPVQLVLDGRVIHTSLLRLKRTRGGALGLA